MDFKIIIIRTAKGQKYAEFIAKEINLSGCETRIIDLKAVRGRLKSNHYPPEKTLIHTRTAGPKKTYDILKGLADQGYRIVNSPEAVRLTSDKYQSCVFAKENHIPCAETFKIFKEDFPFIIADKIKEWGAVIVKPVVSQGQGRFAFKFDKTNIGEAEKVRAIPAKEIVLQKYVDYQRLSRIITIGFKAVRDIVFYDEPVDNWKCSVCLNPKIKLDQNPDQKLLDLAEETARKVGSEISFIDIFTTKEGYVLNEINTACSLVIHERISGYNLSKDIAEYLIAKTKGL